MNQAKNLVVEAIHHELFTEAMREQKKTVEMISIATSIAEGTVKNIVTGKTTHSSAQNVGAICNYLGVPIEEVLGYPSKTEIEVKAAKENDSSILALKEVYEFQIATLKQTNDAHIANIRAHYEQHHEDLRENFEKRLSDKRELIDVLKQENKELKKGNFVCKVIISLFVICTVILLALEFIHPEHGWIRW